MESHRRARIHDARMADRDSRILTNDSQYGVNKFASNLELVALLETMNVLVLGIALAFYGKLAMFFDALRDSRLLAISVAGAALKAGGNLLFQRALQLSPVSLSVPYLAFTPAMLLVTSYFILGERPEPVGVAGVVVMTAGAYGLNAMGGPGADGKNLLTDGTQKCSKSPKPRDAGWDDAPMPSGVLGSGAGAKKGAGRASEAPATAALAAAAPATTAAGPLERGGVASRGNSVVDVSTLGVSGSDSESAHHTDERARFPVKLSRQGRSLSSSRRRASSSSEPDAGAIRKECAGIPDLLPREPGSRLMLCVAVLWSVTSDLDKMGKQAASEFVLFVAVQRFCMWIALTFGLLTRRSPRKALASFSENAPLLFATAVLEMYTMSAYLMALDHLFVSYAIAAKRSGILLSVLSGALFFREKISNRLPYVAVILVGMTMVLLAGNDGHDDARVGL